MSFVLNAKPASSLPSTSSSQFLCSYDLRHSPCRIYIFLEADDILAAIKAQSSASSSNVETRTAFQSHPPQGRTTSPPPNLHLQPITQPWHLSSSLPSDSLPALSSSLDFCNLLSYGGLRIFFPPSQSQSLFCLIAE